MKQLDLQAGSDTGENLVVRYIALGSIELWGRNFKRHDLGGIMVSIMQHGFKDPSKYEPTINDGRGGIATGNGRYEALLEIKRLHDAGEKDYKNTPRGIIEHEGEWYAPIIFGVDAATSQQAESYAIDHNNLTMLGGDFSLTDVMKMWDQDVFGVLEDLAIQKALPYTIDADSFDALANYRAGGEKIMSAEEGNPDYDLLGQNLGVEMDQDTTAEYLEAVAGGKTVKKFEFYVVREKYEEVYGLIRACRQKIGLKNTSEVVMYLLYDAQERGVI